MAIGTVFSYDGESISSATFYACIQQYSWKFSAIWLFFFSFSFFLSSHNSGPRKYVYGRCKQHANMAKLKLKVVYFAKGQNQQGRKSSPNKKLVHHFFCAIPQCIREKERLVVFWCKWVFNVIMIVDKCTIPMLLFPCIWTQRYFQKHSYTTDEPMCKTRNVLRGISLTVSKKWIPL